MSPNDRRELEGSRLYREDGTFDRAASSGFLSPPDEVELDERGEWLIWRKRVIREVPAPGHLKAPGRRILEKFISLADAPPERIRDYAREWGILGICKDHDLPLGHNRPPTPLSVHSAWLCQAHSWQDGNWHVGKDRVSSWRQYAREALALLRIAARLQSDRLGEIEDWRKALKSSEPWQQRDIPFWERRVEKEEEVVAGQVNWWLSLGNVTPMFHWSKVDPTMSTCGGRGITLGSGQGLFGVLAVQLALVMSGADGFATCTNCGNFYQPRRRPRADQRRYCPNKPECQKAKLADAQRDRTRRKKRVHQLCRQGKPNEEIVEEVFGPRSKTATVRKTATIRRWIEEFEGNTAARRS